MPGTTSAFAVAAVLLAAALLLSIAAATRDRLPGDLRSMREIQGWDVPGQRVADAVNDNTRSEYVYFAGGIIATALIAGGARREAVMLIAAILLLAIAQPLIKDIADRPRPDASLVDVRTSYTSESFPSGHAMSSMVLYTTLTLIAVRGRQRTMAGGVAALGVTMLTLGALSSIWLGAHWPSDVLGGLLWGAIVAFTAVLAVDRAWRRWAPHGW